MHIDCRTCVGRGLACDDCVINVLLRHPELETDRTAPLAGIDFDEVERRALANLADVGLVPPLRMVPMVRLDAGASRGSRGIA